MNKIRVFVSVIVLSLIMLIPAYGQFSLPVSVQIGGGIGYVLPAGDLGGTTMDYYSGSKYGLSNGLNLQGKVRFAIAGLNLAGEIDYSSLSNSGNSEPGQGNIDISQKIISFKIGPEFKFELPAVPFTPYVGANLALNHFSSDITFQGVSRISSATYSMTGANRVGIGFNGGALFNFSGFILDVGIQYNFLNLFGKDWQDVNPNVDQRLDSYLALNDEMDPAYAAGSNTHIIGSSRSINTFVITATAMFGL